MPDPLAPQVVTPKAAAQLLGVTVPTIQRQIRAGTMPAVKIGRHYRISKQYVEDLLRRAGTPRTPDIDTRSSGMSDDVVDAMAAARAEIRRHAAA